MRNEAGDIVQDPMEEQKFTAQEWKEKARAAKAAAWDATRATCHQIQDKTVAYSKATDQAIREKPYAAVGIAFGIGMVFGLLATGKHSDRDED